VWTFPLLYLVLTLCFFFVCLLCIFLFVALCTRVAVCRPVLLIFKLNEYTHSMRSPLVHAKTPRPLSRYDNSPCQVHSISPAEPSRVSPNLRRPSMALGSLWPKSSTLPTSRGHMDLVRRMLIGNQLQLLLSSRVFFIRCHLYTWSYRENFSLLWAIVSIQLMVFLQWQPFWMPSWISFKATGGFSRTFSTLFCQYFRC